MNLFKIVLLFQLMKSAIFEVEIAIDWKNYINSDTSLKAFDKNIISLNGIEVFNYLEWVDLSYNKIAEIDLLRNFTSLKWLVLSKNQIKEIDVLENLKSLERLELSSNQVKEIDSLVKLTSLKYLDLSSNSIKINS